VQRGFLPRCAGRWSTVVDPTKGWQGTCSSLSSSWLLWLAEERDRQPFFSPPASQLGSLAAVATKAQGTEVIQPAFSTTLNHRGNMIGIPNPHRPRTTPSMHWDLVLLQNLLKSNILSVGKPVRPIVDVLFFRQMLLGSSAVPLSLNLLNQRPGIKPAHSADHAVSLVQSHTGVTRIGAQLPLMNACIGAEGSPPLRNFYMTLAAKPASIRSTLFCCPDPASILTDSIGTHQRDRSIKL